MGGKSKSSSSSANNQRQITTSADSNDGVVGSAGGDLAINVLDGGVIAEAFKFSGNALDEVFDYGAYATKRALETSDNALDKAFDYGAYATKRALETSDNALDEAFDYGAYATKRTLETSDNALDEAFSFGTNALDVVEGVVIDALNIVSRDQSAQYKQQQAALIELSDRSRTETAQSLGPFTKYFFGTLAIFAVVGGIAYGMKKA